MRIGITGVSGFVGRALAKACVEAKHEVVGFSRHPARDLPNVAEVRGNSELDVSGLDAIVNLAGEPLFGLWTPGKQRRIRDSRVAFTKSLVEAIGKLEAKPEVLVSGSGVGIYGDRGDEMLCETAAPGGGEIAKLAQAWEAEALRAEALGLRVVRARIAMVIGPGGGSAGILGRVFGLGLGGKFGSGRQWVSWISLDDLAQQLLAAVENEALSGAINCVSPNPVTNAEMTKILGKLLKRPTFLAVPAFAPKLALPGMNEMLLFSQRAEPAVLRELGFAWRRETMEAALREALGIEA